MRNLKKILALVLALVMSLSLMATAGAAETTSAASDPYATAKEVLEGLKVFQGNPDGSMNYDQSVTRVQTAALVYRIATSDVTDMQKDMYTNHAFKDVAPTYWGNGYIGYGYNAEIIKGMGDGTFHPDDNVTGYQVLAMILRTLGYGKNHEFEGTNWEVQTAATAKSEGLLNGVSAADETRLGQPASRGLVAQILFNALLQPTVKFSALNPYNYDKDASTLGYQKFKLEEVEAAITANEYADLYDTDTLADGKTQLGDYTIDYTSTLDDIGESRLAYIQNGTKVLHIEESSKNATEETLDKGTLADLLKKAGFSEDAETEPFINFDKVATYSSAYKIKYVLVFDYEVNATNAAQRINDAAGLIYGEVGAAKIDYDKDNNTWLVTREIYARNPITSTDLSFIKNIFGRADLMNGLFYRGQVYVGTQSIVDISDVTTETLKYSYEKFYAEFIEEKLTAVINGNENGNWLKVIDNDGDGKAEYILKTVYTLAQVSRVDENDVYTLDTKDHTLKINGTSCGNDVMNNLTTEKVFTADTLAKDDVVYYAVIDGKAQTYLAEKVTATIEKVDHNASIATTTDGTEYTKSGVHEHIEDEAYTSELREMSGKASFDLFLVRGGYLGAFVKSNLTAKFTLITDGWYNQMKNRVDEYAVLAYDDETGHQSEKDVLTNGSLFISPANVLNNGWGGLKWLGGVSGTAADTGVGAVLNGGGRKVRTTVAAIAADGTILPVEHGSVDGRYQHAMLDLDKVPTQKVNATGTIYYTQTGLGRDTAYSAQYTAKTFDVRTLSNTIWYVVYPNTINGGYNVIRSTGYAAPTVKDSYVEDIYAVGTYQKSSNNLGDNDYFTADVVVIELSQYDKKGDIVFVVDDNHNYTDVSRRNIRIIKEDGSEANVDIDMNVSSLLSYNDYGKDQWKVVQPGFYWMNETSTKDIYYIDRMSAAEIRDCGKITVGQIKQHNWLGANKYAVVSSWTTDTLADVQARNIAAERDADDTWYKDGGILEIVNANKESLCNLSDKTVLYTLAYNSGIYDNSVPTLKVADGDAVLADRVEEIDDDNLSYKWNREDNKLVNQNLTWFDYNDVVVFGNGAYAISFKNVYRDTTVGTIWDYAQRVWESVLPAPEEGTAVTFGTFYGYAFGLDKAGNPVTDTKDTTVKDYDTIALTYAQARNQKTGLEIKGADSYTVKEIVPVPVTTKGIEKFSVTLTKDSKIYTYYFSVEEADKNNELKEVGHIATVDETTGEITFTADSKMLLTSLVKNIKEEQTTLTKARIELKFFDDDGEITEPGARYDAEEVVYGYAVVTSEAGVPNAYWFGDVPATGAYKLVVTENEADVYLEDGTNSVKVEKNADKYTITVVAPEDVSPVIVIGTGTGAKLYKMTEVKGPKAAMVTWTATLLASEVDPENVIYVRAARDDDMANAETPSDTPVLPTEDELKKFGDRVTAADTTLTEVKKVELEDEDKQAELDDAIEAADAAIKAAQALLDPDKKATKAEIETAVAAAEKAVKDAEAIANGTEVKDPTVKLDKATGTVKVGETLQLTATVENAGTEKTVWTSSDTAVATVDQTGKVTGVKEGTADITVTVGKATAICAVTVEKKDAPPAGDFKDTLVSTAADTYTVQYYKTPLTKDEVLAAVKAKQDADKAVWSDATHVTVTWVESDGTETTKNITVDPAESSQVEMIAVNYKGTTTYTKKDVAGSVTVTSDVVFAGDEGAIAGKALTVTGSTTKSAALANTDTTKDLYIYDAYKVTVTSGGNPGSVVVYGKDSSDLDAPATGVNAFVPGTVVVLRGHTGAAAGVRQLKVGTTVVDEATGTTGVASDYTVTLDAAWDAGDGTENGTIAFTEVGGIYTIQIAGSTDTKTGAVGDEVQFTLDSNDNGTNYVGEAGSTTPTASLYGKLNYTVAAGDDADGDNKIILSKGYKLTWGNSTGAVKKAYILASDGELEDLADETYLPAGVEVYVAGGAMTTLKSANTTGNNAIQGPDALNRVADVPDTDSGATALEGEIVYSFKMPARDLVAGNFAEAVKITVTPSGSSGAHLAALWATDTAAVNCVFTIVTTIDGTVSDAVPTLAWTNVNGRGEGNALANTTYTDGKDGTFTLAIAENGTRASGEAYMKITAGGETFIYIISDPNA